VTTMDGKMIAVDGVVIAIFNMMVTLWIGW
jgi:hypothetical protein